MTRGRQFLDRIYALEDAGDVRSFYDDAARDYDEILLAEIGYVSPDICAHTIAPHLPDRDAPLIALGCGTGLAGEALAALGFTHIDGVDYSTQMLAVAERKSCYSSLALADLNAGLDVPDGRYAAAISRAGALCRVHSDQSSPPTSHPETTAAGSRFP